MKIITFISLFCLSILCATALELKSIALTFVPPPDANDYPQMTRGFDAPYFVGGDSLILERINQALFFRLVGEVAPKNYQKELTYPSYSSIVDMETKIFYQNSNLMILETRDEHCGAYCSGSLYYTYLNPKTGILYEEARDLLNPNTTQELLRKLYTKANQAYEKQIRLAEKLNRDLKKEHKTLKPADYEESLDYNNTQIEGYSNCIRPVEERLKDFNLLTDFYPQIILSPTEMTVTKEACFPHVIQALDEVGEVSLHLKKGQFEKYLSPLGLALLGRGNTTIPTTQFFRQLHFGKIADKYPFGIILRPYESNNTNVEGHYYYAKSRKSIPLQGKYDGKHLSLWVEEWVEPDPNGNGERQSQMREIFELNWDGEYWEGTWTDLRSPAAKTENVVIKP